jgi:hypothetical protein
MCRASVPPFQADQHQAADIEPASAQLVLEQRLEMPRRSIKYQRLGVGVRTGHRVQRGKPLDAV